jgi:hypothetical protein
MLAPVASHSCTKNNPEDYEDDDHYIDEFNDTVCTVLLLMLRRVSFTESSLMHIVNLMNRLCRFMGRTTRTSTVCHVNCASDHPSQVDRSTPLGRLLPQLWEQYEEVHRELFGCPRCDTLASVSTLLNITYR